MYYERFRSAIRKDPRTGQWELFDEDPALLSKHFFRHTVECEAEISSLADEIMSKGLESNAETMSPWTMHVIENRGQGCSAVLIRIHHVIGDGMSLVGAMTKVAVDESGEPMTLDLSRFMDSKKSNKGAGQGLSVISMIGKTLSCFLNALLLAVTPYDDETAFTGHDKAHCTMGKNMRTLYFRNYRIEFIKAIKNSAGVSLNDVVLGATAGAVRRYCELFNDETAAEGIRRDAVARALIPFAFPRKPDVTNDPRFGMRNCWAFLSVPMPIGIDGSRNRLRKCHETTLELKQSPMAFVQQWSQSNVLPLLPLYLQRMFVYNAFARHTMVFSNVPGPSNAVYMAGQRVTGIFPIFPNILPHATIISYGTCVVKAHEVHDADIDHYY